MIRCSNVSLRRFGVLFLRIGCEVIQYSSEEIYAFGWTDRSRDKSEMRGRLR